jgi:hypothetical protein
MFQEGGVPGFNEMNKRAQAIALLKTNSWQHVVKHHLDLAMSCSVSVAKEYQMLKYNESRRNDPDVECVWFFGAGGSGKSYKAEIWLNERGPFNAKKVLFIIN